MSKEIIDLIGRLSGRTGKRYPDSDVMISGTHDKDALRAAELLQTLVVTEGDEDSAGFFCTECNGTGADEYNNACVVCNKDVPLGSAMTPTPESQQAALKPVGYVCANNGSGGLQMCEKDTPGAMPIYAADLERAAPVDVSHAALAEKLERASDMLTKGPLNADKAVLAQACLDGAHALRAAGIGAGVVISDEMLEFLRGAGTLKGCSFGETPMGEKGAFWWRKYLPSAKLRGGA